ncbi:MAG: hypothetical protein KR126chlam4_00488 [Candidatus Anoxychlamydiales bacterium]|nr:hypothetical protein [Candidatus Anoxychlamydiales bacterium]
MKDALSSLHNYVKEVTIKVMKRAIYFFTCSYFLEAASPGARAMTAYFVVKS